MRPISVQGEETRAYCKKHPKASTASLARMLRRDHPKLYASDTIARDSVRYYRGLHKAPEYVKNPIPYVKIPEPEPSDWKIYDLPDVTKRWLILADVHLPYHNLAALELIIGWAKKRENRCKGLILLGDFMDYYQLSKFEKDPRKRNAEAELNMGKDMITAFRDALKLDAVVWKCGNHEDRAERYITRRAPELLGVSEVDMADWVGVNQKNDLWVPNGMLLRYGELYLMHGHEWRGGISSPVNPARGAYLKAKECCVVGHQHRTSEHTEPTLSGRTVTTWSVGCACDLHPDYSRINKWNHGFGALSAGHDWAVENHRVVDGTIM